MSVREKQYGREAFRLVRVLKRWVRAPPPNPKTENQNKVYSGVVNPETVFLESYRRSLQDNLTDRCNTCLLDRCPVLFFMHLQLRGARAVPYSLLCRKLENAFLMVPRPNLSNQATQLS